MFDTPSILGVFGAEGSWIIAFLDCVE